MPKANIRGLIYRNDADLKAWLAKRPTEAPLEPGLPIIDPHHHFWDAPHRGRYFLPDLLADIGGGHNIVSTVFLECQAMYRKDGPREMAPVGEVEFVNGIAAMSASGTYGPCRVAEAIIGDADLARRARARCAGSRNRRWRRPLPRHPPWRVMGRRRVDRQFRLPRRAAASGAGPHIPRGLRQLAKLGLSFESWQYHPQLPDAIDLARAFPDTTIILNHVGGVLGVGPYAGHRQEILAGWRKDIAELAKCPNVNVKLGGIGMTSFGFDFHERDVPPSSEELAAAWRQYIEPCIEAFGVNRCMFESNFPPDKQSGGYTELWNAFKRITSGASPAEKTALYSGTARAGLPYDHTLTFEDGMRITK